MHSPTTLWASTRVQLGLELDEIADILALWRTGDCGTTRDQVETLLHTELMQVHRELAELEALQQQLSDAWQVTEPRPRHDGAPAALVGTLLRSLGGSSS